jgi:hypothetical protein
VSKFTPGPCPVTGQFCAGDLCEKSCYAVRQATTVLALRGLRTPAEKLGIKFNFWISATEQDAFKCAASRSGMTTSAWMRDRLRLAAIQELGDDETEGNKWDAHRHAQIERLYEAADMERKRIREEGK